MGGKGSGGARMGAGRKPIEASERFLRGGRDRRKGAVKRAKLAPSAPLPPVDPPKDFTKKEAAVWAEWEPHALAAKTLTVGTAADFADLCRLIVEMEDVLDERRTEGWTSRGLSLAKEYRGLVQRVEAKRRAFRLAPIGKEVVLPEAPKDEWEEFDAPVHG